MKIVRKSVWLACLILLTGCETTPYEPKQSALPVTPVAVKPVHPLADFPLPPYVVIDRIDPNEKVADVAE